jgi:predicted phosphodiesterase
MRIGVVSDPHGCLVGLEAALNWLRAQGTDLVVCAGDVANFGPKPNECISLLVGQEVACVQGNCDRDLLLPPQANEPIDERAAQLRTINDWGKAQLTSSSRRWLAALPARLAPAPGVLIVHGGANNPDEIVDASARPSLPEGVSVVTAGHLHKPFVTRLGQGIWANAGSVGRPCDGDPRAAVAVLEQRTEGWEVSIHRIPFDLEAAAGSIRAANMPYAERLVETQWTACWW